jgi:hypothetical protein
LDAASTLKGMILIFSSIVNTKFYSTCCITFYTHLVYITLHQTWREQQHINISMYFNYITHFIHTASITEMRNGECEYTYFPLSMLVLEMIKFLHKLNAITVQNTNIQSQSN